MAQDTNEHFARITPVDREHSGRVLNCWNLIWYNLLVLGFLVAFGVCWCFLFAVVGFFLGTAIGATAMVTAVLATCLVLIGYFALVCLCFGFAYPEWPLNQIFCRQLLNSVARRQNRSGMLANPPMRVVELVPRTRWNKKLYLDMATDLMTIRVDERGVWMQGDYNCYELPAGSIMGAELVTSRPPGSYPTFRLILYVRTEEGMIDLPISYRDHRWGSLRKSRRRAQVASLTERIRGIAQGHLYLPHQSPIVGHRRPEVRPSTNPYAAPAPI